MWCFVCCLLSIQWMLNFARQPGTCMLSFALLSLGCTAINFSSSIFRLCVRCAGVNHLLLQLCELRDFVLIVSCKHSDYGISQLQAAPSPRCFLFIVFGGVVSRGSTHKHTNTVLLMPVFRRPCSKLDSNKNRSRRLYHGVLHINSSLWYSTVGIGIKLIFRYAVLINFC